MNEKKPLPGPGARGALSMGCGRWAPIIPARPGSIADGAAGSDAAANASCFGDRPDPSAVPPTDPDRS